MSTLALSRSAYSSPSDLARREYLADAFIHALSVGFAIFAAGTFIAAACRQPGDLRAWAPAIYGLSLVVTLSISAAYNLNKNPARVELLRACDHVGIFIMIGGTYTPLAVLGLGGQESVWLMAFMWTTALIGSIIKMRYRRRFERSGIAAYLVLGWVLFLLLPSLGRVMPPEGLSLLAIGAVIYSIGVAFHLAVRLPYNTVLWHICVLGGVICHYEAILRYLPRT